MATETRDYSKLVEILESKFLHHIEKLVLQVYQPITIEFILLGTGYVHIVFEVYQEPK